MNKVYDFKIGVSVYKKIDRKFINDFRLIIY